jgi:protein-disulfide isomerase
MSKDQEMSKRQLRREKRRRSEMRTRLLTIGLITVGALLVAFVLIYPNVKPAGAVVSITPKAYPQDNMNNMGNPNAPVKLEAWEDFQCPACRNYTSNTEPLLIQNYVATGKAYYTFRQYPFIDNGSVGHESDQAANASMCAGEQGRFWDYHEMLFANWNGENLGSYADRRLIAFAESLGLDMGKFRSCFSADTYKAQIDKDFSNGIAAGVHSTPSIFVNGTLVTNPAGENVVPSYENIASAIDAALASLSQ